MEWSKKWTDAHESVEPNPRIHMDMDIHNNLVGIKIVQQNSAVTYAEIINNCIQQMKLGQLVVTDGSKLIPSTIKGFNLPNAFEVIKQRIRELFDYLIDFYRAEQAQTNSDGKNLAHACVNSNFVYGLNRACSIFPHMVDQADKYGCPPIFDAINQRVDKCFTALIGFGANVNFQNPLSGDTPLMEAAVYNEINFVQILLATGADKSLRNFSGSTALDFALGEGNDEIVQLIR